MQTVNMKPRQSGLTLIEMMVAITLGLLLVAAILSVFLSSSRNYSQDDQQARMQENGRFAMRRIVKDVNMIDFWGGMINPDGITNADLGTTAGCSIIYNGKTTLTALDNATATAANTAFSCIDTAEFVPGTDVLHIKRVAGSPTTTYTTGAIYLYTNGTSGKLVDYDGTNPKPDETAWVFAPVIYYIRNTNAAGDAIPTLYVKQLVGSAMQAQELVEGVENMQVEYGIDIDNDQYPDIFVSNPTASQISGKINPNNIVTTTGVVVTARIYLLVRSANTVPGYINKKTYQLGSVSPTTAYAPDDGFYRRVFTNTVAIRNISNLLALD